MAAVSTAPLVSLAAAGGLPGVVLEASDGARAEICLHGAQVVSWLPAGERDNRLFVSAHARFEAGIPLRGGIPVSFPQFADQGPLPSHGFARISTWALVRVERTESGNASALLRLADSPESLALWPYPFLAELNVAIGGRELHVGLTVANPGPSAFAFTGCLHTYLRLADSTRVSIHGLQSARYRDKVLGQDKVVERAPELRIDRPLDRVYYAVPERLEVREPARRVDVHASGFPDTVIWNPGQEGATRYSDLDPDAYLHMICVEAALARAPATIAVNGRWQGLQRLVAA